MRIKKDQPGRASTRALQDAIRRSGLTQREVARQAGIDSSQVSRFMSGSRNMTLGTAEKVAEAVGVEIRVVRRPKKRKGR